MRTSMICFIIIASIISSFITGCKSDSNIAVSGSDAYTISGTVTAVDENFGSGDIGSYKVGAFVSWPPTSAPVASAHLNFVREGNLYKCSYKLKNLELSGFNSFVVAVGWRTTYGWHSPVLGLYGCDTSRQCAGTVLPNVTVSRDIGTVGIDFKCFSDTAKKLF